MLGRYTRPQLEWSKWQSKMSYSKSHIITALPFFQNGFYRCSFSATIWI